jgi:hypothetical protein
MTKPSDGSEQNADIDMAIAGRTTKTKRVRVFVVMDRAGNFEVMGSSDNSEENIELVMEFTCRDFEPQPWSSFWTEIEVPYPSGNELVP